MFRSAAIIAGFAFLANAQIARHVTTELATPRDLSGKGEAARRIVESLPPTLADVPAGGSWEEHVLDGARQVAVASFALTLQKPTGIVTTDAGQGDVLIARWNFPDESRGFRTVWLWDTPSDTDFVFDVDKFSLSRQRLPDFCEGLFEWKGPRIIDSLVLLYDAGQSAPQTIIGRAAYQSSQQGVYHVYFTAMAEANGAHVVVEVSKSRFADAYPPGSVFVPERFPPLSSRLAQVSRGALFDEIGRGYQKPPWYPRERDEIVLRELLSRGPLTDLELRQIVIGSFGRGTRDDSVIINDRMAAFTDALASRDQLGRYASMLERLLLATPIFNTGQDIVISNLFRAARTTHLNLSSSALSFVQNRKFVDQSLLYLGNVAEDEETLRLLSAASVDPAFEENKRRAVQRIRDRILPR